MYAKHLLNSIGETKKKDSNTIISETTKGIAVGAAVGGGVGLLAGLIKKKNLLLTSFIGAVLGAGVTKFIKR